MRVKELLLATTMLVTGFLGLPATAAKADEIIKICDHSTDAKIYSITLRTAVVDASGVLVTINQGYTTVNAAGVAAPLTPNTCNLIDVATPLVGGLTLFADLESPAVKGDRASVPFGLVQITSELRSLKIVDSPYVSGGPYPLMVNVGPKIPTSLGGKTVVWVAPDIAD